MNKSKDFVFSSENFFNVCRVCFSEDKSSLLDLCSSMFMGTPVLEILELCVSQNISRNDGLPMNICQDCLLKLLQTHSFINQFKHSNALLTSVCNQLFLSSTQNKTIVNINYIVSATNESLLNSCDLKEMTDETSNIFLKKLNNNITSSVVNDKNVDDSVLKPLVIYSDENTNACLFNCNKNELITCEYCQQKISREELIDHVYMKHVICPFCMAEMARENLNGHILIKHKDGVFSKRPNEKVNLNLDIKSEPNDFETKSSDFTLVKSNTDINLMKNCNHSDPVEDLKKKQQINKEGIHDYVDFFTFSKSDGNVVADCINFGDNDDLMSVHELDTDIVKIDDEKSLFNDIQISEQEAAPKLVQNNGIVKLDLLDLEYFTSHNKDLKQTTDDSKASLALEEEIKDCFPVADSSGGSEYDFNLYMKENENKAKEKLTDLEYFLTSNSDAIADNWICNLCTNEFDSEELYVEHCKLEHTSAHKCYLCPKMMIFSDFKVWEMHRIEKHGLVRCTLCPCLLRNEKVEKHLKTVHSKILTTTAETTPLLTSTTDSELNEKLLWEIPENLTIPPSLTPKVNSATSEGCLTIAKLIDVEETPLQSIEELCCNDHTASVIKTSLDDVVETIIEEAVLKHWTCLVCQKIFNSLGELFKHVDEKHKNMYNCLKCKIEHLFFDEMCFKEHNSVVHKVLRYDHSTLTAINDYWHKHTDVAKWYHWFNASNNLLPSSIITNIKYNKYNSFRTTLENDFPELISNTHSTVCDKCSIDFESIISYVNHCTLKHSPVFNCMVCPMTFMKFLLWENHILAEHGLMRCEECFLLIINENMGRHLKTAHATVKKDTVKSTSDLQIVELDEATASNKWTCFLCTQIYFRLEDFSEHLNNKHPTMFNCTKCKNESLYDKLSLDQHNSAVHKEINNSVTNKFYCGSCSIHFESRAFYDDHCKLEHSSESKNISNDLKIHKLELRELVKCIACDFMMEPINLMKHLVTVHKDLLDDDGVLDTRLFSIRDSPETKNLSKPSSIASSSTNISESHLSIGNSTEGTGAHTFPIKCCLCKNATTYINSYATFKLHLAKKHKDDAGFLCAICKCSTIFKTKSELNKHRLFDHDYVHCDPCSNYVPRAVLQDHMSRVHEINYYEDKYCSTCKIVFKSISQLNKHIRGGHIRSTVQVASTSKSTTVRIPKKKCKTCGKEFSDTDMLDRHQLFVHEFLTCSECDREFDSDNATHARDQHFKDVHGKSAAKSKTKTCAVCSKEFLTRVAILKHYAMAHPYNCTVCEREFNSVTARDQHMTAVHPSYKQ